MHAVLCNQVRSYSGSVRNATWEGRGARLAAEASGGRARTRGILAVAATAAWASGTVVSLATFVLCVPQRAEAATHPLNDTGLNRCLRTDGTVTTRCKTSGQDAGIGRDVSVPDNSDGRLGFSFIKVNASGQALAPTAKAWTCVKDAVTGLLWEIKTHDGGLRDYHLQYTNFRDGRAGDSSSFVAAVNAQGLCGHADWRLPTRTELLGIVNYGRQPGAVAIDQKWFPDTANTWTWSANTFAGGTVSAWALDFSVAHIYYGKDSKLGAVRLVRSDEPPAQPDFVPADGEVLDASTGLVWSRCSDGQSWDGSSCNGTPFEFTWSSAVERAKVVAGNTGLPWRLPDPKELVSIVDATQYSPTIDLGVFPGTPADRYWTGSFDSDTDHTAFFVNFMHGGTYDHDRSRLYPIRLVRTAPALHRTP